MVAAELGVAVLPKPACVPIIRAMNHTRRLLTDAWARRQVQIAIRPDAVPRSALRGCSNSVS